MSSTFVIVGANLAGGRAAETLRSEGFDGRILLIGAEAYRPYERPPLSKEVLSNAGNLPDSFYLRLEEYYQEQKIEMLLGSRVERLDLAGKQIELDNGTSVSADKVLLCTGANARRLEVPGADLMGIHYLRTLDEALALSKYLVNGAPVVIAGMGVIGAEVAASAVKNGCQVTAVEPMTTPMERSLGRELGGWLADVHVQRGVDLRLGTGIEKFNGAKGKVREVVTTEGDRLDAEVVVVGIGIDPAAELALDAGIKVNNGVLIDDKLQTSVTDVYAAGDVANQFNPALGQRVRLETYENAQNQGIAAARAMLGREVNFGGAPWFWSDQYDLNIQIAGDVTKPAQIVCRGEAEAENFSVFFVRDGSISGLATINRPQDMAFGRRMVTKGTIVTPEVLRDENVSLRDVLAGKMGI